MRKTDDNIQCGFKATPMPTWAKTLLVGSETPCTYGIEIKAEYVSGFLRLTRSLFTSVPLEAARTVVLDRLSNDSTLEDRTTLSIAELTEALDLCLNSSYFTYDSTIYKQVFGTPMG